MQFDKMVHAKILRYAHAVNGVNTRMLGVNGPTSRTRRVSTAVANPLAMTLTKLPFLADQRDISIFIQVITLL